MTKLSLISKTRPVAVKTHVIPSTPPSRILCATDLWGESDHALQKSLWLAETTDAELLLLHVVDDETPLRITGRRAEHARGALQWRVRRWPEFKPRPAVSVRIGDPHRTISRVARQWHADLVVMGSTRPRLMDRLVPTTAERVAAEARCAVLVANDSKPEAYRHAAIVAKSCCQAAALERISLHLPILHSSRRVPANLREETDSLLREPPDCVVVAAERWPALSGVFRLSAASILARSRTTDVLIAPPRRPGSAMTRRCSTHSPARPGCDRAAHGGRYALCTRAKP